MTITGKPIVRQHGRHVYVLCPRGHYVTSTDNWAGSLLAASVAFGDTITCTGPAAPDFCGWTRSLTLAAS